MESVLGGTIGLAVIGLAVSLLLSRSARRFAGTSNTVVDSINRLLPQTQCAQCGYPGCKPYAQAIANGEAINKCPPGGDETILALADLLGRQVTPLDPDCGEAAIDAVAVIREDECIGCTLCLEACPVDAIVGAKGHMHTVIESECTGCELCLPPCPVDCIDLVPGQEEHLYGAEPPATVFDCIRCGACEDACPRDLKPQELYWYRDAPGNLEALELDACIECRRCDRVCPSNIPLTDIFKTAKLGISQQEARAARARYAEARFDARNARLASRQARVRGRPSENEKAALLDSIKRKRQS